MHFIGQQWKSLQKDVGRIISALKNQKKEDVPQIFWVNTPSQWIIILLAILVGLIGVIVVQRQRRKPSATWWVENEEEAVKHGGTAAAGHARPPLNDDRFVVNTAVGSAPEPEPVEITPSFDSLLNKFDKGAAVRHSKVIVLWSSLNSLSSRMIDLFAAKKLSALLIDGASPEDKEIRDELFAISGMRGKYPQCFLRRGRKGNRRYEFVGNWETVETLVESDSIPADFLALHPEIPTFSTIFESAERVDK
jgi:hypothetical protein